jgi:hypothetical protein
MRSGVRPVVARRAEGVLVCVLVFLLGAGGGRDAAAASPEEPEDMTAFTYEQYCNTQGRFTYDGAALKLVKRPAHLALLRGNGHPYVYGGGSPEGRGSPSREG